MRTRSLRTWLTMRDEAARHVAARLVAAWTLAGQRPPYGNRMRVAPVSDEQGQILATLTHQGHRGLLLLPARREGVSIEQGLRPEAGGTLAAEVASFTDQDGATKQGVHVWCREPGLDDAFTMFCALLCYRLQSDPVRVALPACFEEFRRLIGVAGTRVPPDVIGAVGELLWLARLIESDRDAVLAWMGPSGGRHDFRRGATAVEVKTSLRSSSQVPVVHISAIDQLVPPDGGRLFLHVVRLEQAADGDLTLERLVAQIGASLVGEGLSFFEAQLAQLGILDRMPQSAFSLLGTSTYAVEEGFPCLTPDGLVGGALPLGVSSVSYAIQLDAASRFRVACDEAAAALASGGAA